MAKSRKYLILLILFTFHLSLLSCGGGGGGGGDIPSEPPPPLYSGLTTPAVITANNAMNFVGFLFNRSLEPPDINTDTLEVSLNSAAINAIADSFAFVAKAINRTLVSDTIYGSISGYVTYSGYIDTDYTGTITFQCTDFNDGDGITLDGKFVLKILVVDAFNLEITHAVIEFWSLRSRSETDDFTLSGIIESFYDITNTRFTDIIDMDGIDNNSNEAFRYEDLSSVMTCNEPYLPSFCSEEILGRIYLENEGYVELSTASPLLYHSMNRFNVNVPDAGGPVYANGDRETRIRMTPLSIVDLQIDIDVDEDADYEYSDTYTWYELAGLVITFEDTYGSTSQFDVALAAVPTADNGYIAAGWSNTGFANAVDFMLVKTDGAGAQQWSQTLGGVNDEYAMAVRQTADGGYVVAGYTDTWPDFGIIYKLNASGGVIWSQTTSSDPVSRIYDIIPTSDGGYLATGYRYGPAGDDFSREDLYLVKLDQDGAIVWENTYGGLYTDIGYSVIEVSSGGFLAVGTREFYTDTFDQDIAMVRIDASGNLIWETSFGGQYTQYGFDVLEDAAGDFLISGTSYTIGSGYVYTLHKLNAVGSMVFQTSFDSTTNNLFRSSITSSGDGGYIIVANDSFDVEMFKLDSTGNNVWQRSFNWSPYMVMCTATSVEQAPDGGYIIGGSAWPSTGKDFYLIKTDSGGNIISP